MTDPRRNLTDLLGDESAGLRPPRELGTRLHRCRRGNISILVLFFGLVFYGLAAMIWNTGQVTSAKMEAQTAADASAYASAVWTSRAINITTATNMAILRQAMVLAASGGGLGVNLANIMIWVNWIKAANQAAAPCGPAWAACFASYMSLIWSLEGVPMYLPWAQKVLPLALDPRELAKPYTEIWKMHSYQIAWIEAVPRLIEAQRQAMEDYFDCDIRLMRGDGAPLAPPLFAARRNPARANPASFLIPFMTRWYFELWRNKDGWRKSKEFKFMFVGRGKVWWQRNLYIGIGFALAYAGFNHTVLASQWGPLEFGPAAFNQWPEFTIVAAARKRQDNSTSRQPPRYPLRFMASGFFDDPVNPVAYAQAETFNGIDGHLSLGIGPFAPFQYLASLYPFRVWTHWGWQWQPRLNDGDLVPNLAAPLFDFPDGTDVSIPSAGAASVTGLH